MERRKRAIIILITLLLSTQTVSAGPAEAVEAGVVFGANPLKQIPLPPVRTT